MKLYNSSLQKLFRFEKEKLFLLFLLGSPASYCAENLIEEDQSFYKRVDRIEEVQFVEIEPLAKKYRADLENLNLNLIKNKIPGKKIPDSVKDTIQILSKLEIEYPNGFDGSEEKILQGLKESFDVDSMSSVSSRLYQATKFHEFDQESEIKKLCSLAQLQYKNERKINGASPKLSSAKKVGLPTLKTILDRFSEDIIDLKDEILNELYDELNFKTMSGVSKFLDTVLKNNSLPEKSYEVQQLRNRASSLYRQKDSIFNLTRTINKKSFLNAKIIQQILEEYPDIKGFEKTILDTIMQKFEITNYGTLSCRLDYMSKNKILQNRLEDVQTLKNLSQTLYLNQNL